MVGKENSEGGIAVNEGGEDMGTVFDNNAEEEDEQRCGGQVAKVEAEEWSWPVFKKSAESGTTRPSRIRLEVDRDESDTRYLDSA